MRVICRNLLWTDMWWLVLTFSRHPDMEHVASLRLCLDVFHQLGTSSSDAAVNGRLPHALPILSNAFQTMSLIILLRQSLFLPSRAHSIGQPHVFSGDLPRSALRRPQNQAAREALGRLTNDLYQPLKG